MRRPRPDPRRRQLAHHRGTRALEVARELVRTCSDAELAALAAGDVPATLVPVQVAAARTPARLTPGERLDLATLPTHADAIRRAPRTA